MVYYCDKHIPMVRQLLGSSCTNVAVEQGIAGGTPGSRATYIVMAHLYFDNEMILFLHLLLMPIQLWVKFQILPTLRLLSKLVKL